MDVTTREMTGDDQGYVIQTWMRSEHESPMWSHVPQGIYRVLHRELICRTLLRSKVVLAVSPSDPTFIIGWVCFEETPVGVIVHYVYTRRSERRKGLQRALFQALHLSPIFHTAWTHLGGCLLAGLKLVVPFNPYLR